MIRETERKRENQQAEIIKTGRHEDRESGNKHSGTEGIFKGVRISENALNFRMTFIYMHINDQSLINKLTAVQFISSEANANTKHNLKKLIQTKKSHISGETGSLGC